MNDFLFDSPTLPWLNLVLIQQRIDIITLSKFSHCSNNLSIRIYIKNIYTQMCDRHKDCEKYYEEPYLFRGGARLETQSRLDGAWRQVVRWNVKRRKEVGLCLSMADTPPPHHLTSMHVAGNRRNLRLRASC